MATFRRRSDGMTFAEGHPAVLASPRDFERLDATGNGSGVDAIGEFRRDWAAEVKTCGHVCPWSNRDALIPCGAICTLPTGHGQNIGHAAHYDERRPNHGYWTDRGLSRPDGSPRAPQDDLDRPKPKAMTRGQLLVEIGRAVHAAFPERADEIVRALEERLPQRFVLAVRGVASGARRIDLSYSEDHARWEATLSRYGEVGQIEHPGQLPENTRRSYGAAIYVNVEEEERTGPLDEGFNDR